MVLYSTDVQVISMVRDRQSLCLQSLLCNVLRAFREKIAEIAAPYCGQSKCLCGLGVAGLEYYYSMLHRQ